jgi:hypothetical protein
MVCNFHTNINIDQNQHTLLQFMRSVNLFIKYIWSTIYFFVFSHAYLHPYLFLLTKYRCLVMVSKHLYIHNALIIYQWHATFIWGLWCLTPLLTIFQLYRGGQFYWMEETGVPGEGVKNDLCVSTTYTFSKVNCNCLEMKTNLCVVSIYL